MGTPGCRLPALHYMQYVCIVKHQFYILQASDLEPHGRDMSARPSPKVRRWRSPRKSHDSLMLRVRNWKVQNTGGALAGSGAGRSLKGVGGTDPSRSAGKFFLVVSLHILALKAQLVILVSAFVVVSTVWSVYCLPFLQATRGAPRPPPLPHGVGTTVSSYQRAGGASTRAGGKFPQHSVW